MKSQTIITLTLLYLFKLYYCETDKIVHPPSGQIFYFAYGSNILTRRMHFHNPSAIYHDIAILKGYRFDFNMFEENWQGAVSTIVQDEAEEVWGVVWLLTEDEVYILDRQEGVHDGWYFPKNVTVITPSGAQLMARTYEEYELPNKTAPYDIPYERLPSSTYLQMIALGAIEHLLPTEYVGFIFSFPTNGRLALSDNRDKLGYPF